MPPISEKYFQLYPDKLKDERIHTINIPEYNSLSEKIQKIIEKSSIKNNTTEDHEYRNWWIPKVETLVEKAKTKGLGVKFNYSNQETKLEGDEYWKQQVEDLEKKINEMSPLELKELYNNKSMGKTKRKRKKRRKPKTIRKYHTKNHRKKRKSTRKK